MQAYWVRIWLNIKIIEYYQIRKKDYVHHQSGKLLKKHEKEFKKDN